jgi:hypothetical protein
VNIPSKKEASIITVQHTNINQWDKDPKGNHSEIIDKLLTKWKNQPNNINIINSTNIYHPNAICYNV